VVAADPVTCTIIGTSPSTVVLGTTAQTVRFGVQTDCDGKYPVSWVLNSDIYPGSSGASWLLLRNYHYPYGEKFTHVEDPEGDFPVTFIGAGPFQGNQMVGVHPLQAAAFYDADADGVADSTEPVSYVNGSFLAQRADTFGDSFQAVPRRRHGAQLLDITGSLQLANWDTGQYEGRQAWVELQFRPAGSRHFRTVKRVWDDGAAASTTVRATRTGAWRYHFRGDEGSGAATSVAVTIAVHRPHHG
jgi:hypothetical protein